MKISSIEDIQKRKLEAQIEDNIFLKAIAFGLEHPGGFSYKEIIEGLGLTEDTLRWEKAIVEKYLHSAHTNARQSKVMGESGNNETPFLLLGHPHNSLFQDDSHRYSLTLDAHFKYLDYQELKFAREASREARTLSMWAIGISVFAIVISSVISIWLAFFNTQTVKLDPAQVEILKPIPPQLGSQ